MKKILLLALLSAACSTAQVKPDEKKTRSVDDDTVEKGSLEKMAPKNGLTKTFSYRQLRWESEEKKVLYKMGKPIADFENEELKLFTFPSKTRGFPTTVTTGLINNKLVTLDINIIHPTQCNQALPKWQDALRLKYGPLTAEKENYILWKLQDASIIVIEKGERCGIVYAKDAQARKRVNALVR